MHAPHPDVFRHRAGRRLAAALLLGLGAAAPATLPALDCGAIGDAEARACCERSLPVSSMTQTLRAALVDDSGTLREVGGELAWKRLPKGQVGLRVDITAPPGDAGTILLLVHREAELGERPARPQALLYNPTDRRDRLIAVDALSGELLGTDFSYEDFAFIYGVRSDLAIERRADETVAGQDVMVLEAVPVDADAAWEDGMRYSRIVTRIDRARCVALDTRFYEKDSEPRKELVADPAEIREHAGRWLPYRFTMHDHQRKTRTVVSVEKVAFEAELSDFFFARAALKRGR